MEIWPNNNNKKVQMSMLSLNSIWRQSKNNKKFLYISVNLKKTLKLRTHKVWEVDKLSRTFRNVNKNNKMFCRCWVIWPLWIEYFPKTNAGFPKEWIVICPFVRSPNCLELFGDRTLLIWVLKEESREGTEDWLRELL